jgi:(2Fe-2S) ferredoxin
MAFAMIASLVGATGCTNSCESMPMLQFRLNGITYYSQEDPVGADLGPVVGTITKEGLPAGASRCESYTLQDGQGTPPKGSEVHTINGVDPSVALAVVEPDGRTFRYTVKA